VSVHDWRDLFVYGLILFAGLMIGAGIGRQGR